MNVGQLIDAVWMNQRRQNPDIPYSVVASIVESSRELIRQELLNLQTFTDEMGSWRYRMTKERSGTAGAPGKERKAWHKPALAFIEFTPNDTFSSDLAKVAPRYQKLIAKPLTTVTPQPSATGKGGGKSGGKTTMATKSKSDKTSAAPPKKSTKSTGRSASSRAT